MKIIYFYQYFSTPKGSWGTRVYEFAKNWVSHGHEVTVVTAVYSKSDLKAAKFLETQYIDGIKVKIINVNIDNKQTITKRLWSWFIYAFYSTWYALTLKADVVIASSGPITAGIPGLAAHYLRRRKFIFEVRDLWPQGAIEMGMLNNKIMRKLAFWFERRCYKAANSIVALSAGMVDDIKNRITISNIISVTNSADIKLFGTLSQEDIGEWKNRKYAIYTGNIGAVNNSQWLLDSALHLKNKGYENIYILLIGEGQLRESLEKQAQELGITNFIRLGLMPKTQLVAYIQHSMASLVPLKGTPVLDTSSPNKFFESLAAGIPVIQNTKGWMKKYLDENEVGFTVEPDDSEKLADLLIKLSSDEQLLKTMGEKASKLAKKDFDKDILAEKMLKAIENTIKQ